MSLLLSKGMGSCHEWFIVVSRGRVYREKLRSEIDGAKVAYGTLYYVL
jgi:hypothetical protein